jgi:hypothetical protein
VSSNLTASARDPFHAGFFASKILLNPVKEEVSLEKSRRNLPPRCAWRHFQQANPHMTAKGRV